MVSQKNATNPINPSTNWLGDPTSMGNPSSPQSFTPVPFLISGTLKPTHAIDSSWNHTALIPQPDSSGLIHGWDADTYDAIGPHLIISKSRDQCGHLVMSNRKLLPAWSTVRPAFCQWRSRNAQLWRNKSAQAYKYLSFF